MTDLRRTVRCSNCGYEATVSLSSDLEVREVMFAGKCRCGSTLQVSYSLVGEQQQGMQKTEPSEGMVNLDETIFAPEMPSDTLRDIMED